MQDLLGEMDVNVANRRYSPPMKAIKSESRRKVRVLSPPLTESKRGGAHNEESSLTTPPPEVAMIDNDGFPALGDDNLGSDAAIGSSPVTRAVERKAQVAIKIEEDDDALEVAQAISRSGVVSANVNMSGKRPVKKIDYPTPDSSSPTRPPAEVIDDSSWTNVTNKLNVLSGPPSETVTVGKMQSQDALEEDGSLDFFWLDYTELNGSLLLFGKVKNKKTGQYASCFVKVDNVLRKLFFLPREHRQKHGHETIEEVDMGAVYEEVASLMSKMRVTMHKMKPCERKYAFELPDIPREGEYLKLLYPYDKPVLPVDTTGETFSHVFGTNTSIFEQFVLWKNIMGPCWLKIQDADFGAVNNASWCKLELQVTRPNEITVLGESDNLEAPPLTLMSIALRTMMNEKDNKQEILLASARIYENISLTDTTPAEKLPCKTLTIMRPVADGYPTGFKMDVEKHVGNVKMEKTEQGLLSLFMAHLASVDPDVLMGHKLEDIDYSILLNRMRERKTPGWHRIGRLRRSEWPKASGKGGAGFFAERQLVAGKIDV